MRLHRGGDRSANNALWRVAFNRYNNKNHAPTQAYKKHRLTHTGATDLAAIRRDTIRRLERAIIRELMPDLITITTRIATHQTT